MSGDDDTKLLARLAELRRQREAEGKAAAGPRVTPASAGERRERLRAMREKRLSQHETGEAAAPATGPVPAERSGLLRNLAEKRAQNGGAGLRNEGGDGQGRSGEFLKRILARRKEAPAAEAANGGDRPLAALMRRRRGEGDAGPGVSADARKTRERLEKMIRKLEDRLEQLDGKPAADVIEVETSTGAGPATVEILAASPEK